MLETISNIVKKFRNSSLENIQIASKILHGVEKSGMLPPRTVVGIDESVFGASVEIIANEWEYEE